jgi:hypothetical protein
MGHCINNEYADWGTLLVNVVWVTLTLVSWSSTHAAIASVVDDHKKGAPGTKKQIYNKESLPSDWLYMQVQLRNSGSHALINEEIVTDTYNTNIFCIIQYFFFCGEYVHVLRYAEN